MATERILVVNMKAYEASFRVDVVEALAAAASKAERETGVRVVIAPPAPLLLPALRIHKGVYAQHVDTPGLSARTGRLPVEALRLLGVEGFIINHSEYKVSLRHLREVIARAAELGLESLVCADTPEEAAAVAALRPSMVAVEPPELIGTGVSVSKARPGVITGAVEAVQRVAPETPVLAGAGISSGEDAAAAVRFGASGVLVASYVVKHKNPSMALRELAEALTSV